MDQHNTTSTRCIPSSNSSSTFSKKSNSNHHHGNSNNNTSGSTTSCIPGAAAMFASFHHHKRSHNNLHATATSPPPPQSSDEEEDVDYDPPDPPYTLAINTTSNGVQVQSSVIATTSSNADNNLASFGGGGGQNDYFRQLDTTSSGHWRQSSTGHNLSSFGGPHLIPPQAHTPNRKSLILTSSGVPMGAGSLRMGGSGAISMGTLQYSKHNPATGSSVAHYPAVSMQQQVRRSLSIDNISLASESDPPRLAPSGILHSASNAVILRPHVFKPVAVTPGSDLPSSRPLGSLTPGPSLGSYSPHQHHQLLHQSMMLASTSSTFYPESSQQQHPHNQHSQNPASRSCSSHPNQDGSAFACGSSSSGGAHSRRSTPGSTTQQQHRNQQQNFSQYNSSSQNQQSDSSQSPNNQMCYVTPPLTNRDRGGSGIANQQMLLQYTGGAGEYATYGVLYGGTQVVHNIPSSPSDNSGDAEPLLRRREIEVLQLRQTMERNEMAITTAFEEKKAEWQRQIAYLRSVIAQLEAAIQAASERAKQSDSAGSECRRELSTRTAELQSCQSQYRQVQSELQSSQSQCRQLQVELQASQSQCRQLQSEHQSPSSRYGGTLSNGDSHSTRQPGTPQDNSGDSSAQVSLLQQTLHDMHITLESERGQWLAEKTKVINFQKHLQLNYLQLNKKTQRLESEVEQLTLDLERKELLLMEHDIPLHADTPLSSRSGNSMSSSQGTLNGKTSGQYSKPNSSSSSTSVGSNNNSVTGYNNSTISSSHIF